MGKTWWWMPLLTILIPNSNYKWNKTEQKPGYANYPGFCSKKSFSNFYLEKI